MATFLPNVQDVFAGPVKFTPDFNRVERMLRLRETNYEQGAAQVRSLYDSIFNSPMLRDMNIKTRDKYLKTITDGLKTVSGLDMSLPQNRLTATNLFTPITTDKDIVKDIAFTKQYMNEVSRVDAMRTSSDPETRKQYWDLGKRALEYKAEEFKNADNATALGMSAPTYTPKVDVLSLSEKAFKDAGISVKEDTVNGGYIFTKKNGDAVFPISQAFVTTLFSQDPAVQEMMNTQAYVERKDFIKQNAAKYGSEQAAESFYISNVYNAAYKTIANSLDNDIKDVAVLQDKMKAWDNLISSRGIIPDPNNEEYLEYLHDKEALAVAEAGVKQTRDQLAVYQNIKFDNLDDARAAVDNLVALSSKDMLTNEVARILSYKNAELTVKADPYSLTAYRSQLMLQNQRIMQGLRYADWVRKLDEQKLRGIGPYKPSTGNRTSNSSSNTGASNPFFPWLNPGAGTTTPGATTPVAGAATPSFGFTPPTQDSGSYTIPGVQ